MLNSHSSLCLVQSYLILFPKTISLADLFLHTKWQRNIQYIFIKMYYFPLKCTNFPLKCTTLTLKWTNVTKMYNFLTKMFNFLSEILTFFILEIYNFYTQMNKFHQTVQFVVGNRPSVLCGGLQNCWVYRNRNVLTIGLIKRSI